MFYMEKNFFLIGSLSYFYLIIVIFFLNEHLNIMRFSQHTFYEHNKKNLSKNNKQLISEFRT